MPPHLALIGAGITGTTLSIALTRRHIPHTVYEQAPHPTELGAGLGFGPNAARAMAIADPVLGAGETEPVWIEFLDGTADGGGVFAGFGEGHGAVHRAKWLGVLLGMVPGGVVQFGKRLEGVERLGGKVVLRFGDGTTAEADAVVGCDGVKSKVREIMVGGGEVEGARCGYSGKYAYRCMIPRELALEELGIERVEVSSLGMGHGRHVLTFPVGKPGGEQFLNLVAFVTDANKSWPSQDTKSFTLPATMEDALRDFEQRGFSKTIQKLLHLTKDKMDKWGLFDMADHPLPKFYSDGILVIGDAAHASTPHHGSGAGFCMEDVAVLASLLEEIHGCDVEPYDGLHEVFAAFDESRGERDQWLVHSSRRAAELYQWRLPDTGKEHFEAMRRDVETRQAVCWGIDLEKVIQEARVDLRRRRRAAK
ncbi:uncharacterized protein B0H64DRAFT_451521 [Chaetomium fimeti]|uniref:FAD-binding domain-containing protein n=1 Tax=Chaetomium fimeti TaxID=1854472 RepID=A0AAE0H6X0_9PEZI|nr:hypothetical protein B0H64DRAFT_451521 [Chaetomium fimeti]